MRYNSVLQLLIGLLTLPLAEARAQSIRGKVLNEVTGLPVVGAIVEVIPEASGTPRQLVTNRAGVFLLPTAPRGGYSWRVMAIGYSASLPRSFTLSAEDLILPDLRLKPAALPLINLATSGSKICTGNSNPLILSNILESAQNSIEVMDATIRSGAYLFEVYDSTIATGRAVRPPKTTSVRYLQSWPARSIDPEMLRTGGFSAVDSSSRPTRRYFGPDPLVIFSPWFLADHCFTLEERRNGKDSTIVVRYEPISKIRSEIAGEMQIDRSTMAVKKLTWEHRNLPKWIDPKSTGGEMVFDTLSAGVWYPTTWTMRAPSETIKQAGRLDNLFEAPTLVAPVTGLLVKIAIVTHVTQQRP